MRVGQRDPFDPVLFDRVDQTQTPSDYIRLLDAIRNKPNSQRVREWSAESLALGDGDLVLDLGCGTGDDLIAASRQIGPTGLAVGVDLSVTLLAEAKARSGDIDAIRLIRGNAERLPFKTGTFTGCRVERVLMHTKDPASVVDEILRVLAPRGRVTIVEPDYDAWFVDSPDPEIDAKVVHAVNRQQRPNVGRTLLRLLRTTGFADIEISGHLAIYQTVPGGIDVGPVVQRLVDAGDVEADRGQNYLRALAAAGANNALFSSVPVLSAKATKPRPR